MIKNPYAHRDRAINALASLVGDDGKERFYATLSRTLLLPCGLAIAAGDESRALDPYALKPFALKEGVSVIATWTDKMLSGHNFEIDVVLNDGDEAVHHQALRLWLAERHGAFLVAPDGDDLSIVIDAAGVRLTGKPPYRDKAERMLGIATGQALLQQRVFAGSPFATPLPRNFGR